MKDWKNFLQPAELAVLMSGTVSMGLEILAGRMLAPEFGSSIYTWGGIIGIFMTSLSLGYYIGGRRSSRASRKTISRILLYSGIYISLLLLAGDWLIGFADSLPLGPEYAALPAVVLLFGPPAYILGLISPYATQLSRKTRKGEASGQIFALGTIGSIIGSFAATFVLIPSFSVNQVLLILISLALLGSLMVYRSHLNNFIAGLVLLLAITGFAWNTASVPVGGETVYETQTPYQKLKIVDKGNTRTLYLNGQPNSAMSLDGSEKHVYEYTEYFHAPFLISEDINRVLFIGGGGFTGPKHFASRNVSVDVVEIDPGVVNAAKDHFRVNESNMDIYVQDGRQYLQETNKTYDLIVVDAYKADEIPFHLTTKEFYGLVNRRLDSDGVVLANVIATPHGPGSEFFKSEHRTIDQVFESTYTFRTSTAPLPQNIEIIGSKSQKISKSELKERARTRETGANLTDNIDMLMENVKSSGAQVLRDDDAPVNSMAAGQR